MKQPILQQDLAELLAERWFKEEDIDRIAEGSGLSLADISRYKRPIDHWSAVVAEAIDQRAVSRVVENAELGDDVRRRFARLDERPAGAAMAPSLRFTLEWADVDDDDREKPWLGVTGETRRAVSAEVRVFGGTPAQPPKLRWRRRRVLGFERWEDVALTPLVEDQRGGFAAYEASTTLQAGSVRAWRLDAEARVDDQRQRLNRLLVPNLGVYAAGLVGALFLAFIVWWLFDVPGATFNLGMGGGAVVIAAAILQGLVVRDGARGPLWGLGMVERAMVASLVASALLVVVPPYVLVIVENSTSIPVPLASHDKSVSEIGPGRHTFSTWDAPLATAGDGDICVCHVDSDDDPGCSCAKKDGDVRGIAVRYVQCRKKEWSTGVDKSPTSVSKDVELLAQRIWLPPGKDCVPLADASVTYDLEVVSPGAAGTLTVHHPWKKDLGSVHIGADAVTPHFTITSNASESRLVEITTTRGAPLTIPALDLSKKSSLSIWFDDESSARSGSLSCDARKAVTLDIVAFELPAAAEVAIRGTVSSRWSTASRLPRACRSERDIFDEVKFTLDKPLRGAVFTSPFKAKHIAFQIGQSPVISSKSDCPDGASLATVDASIRDPIKLTQRQPPTHLPPRPAPSWDIVPVDAWDQHLALICDPPSREIEVFGPVTPGVPTKKYKLSAAGVAPVAPPPPPTPGVCRFFANNPVAVDHIFACPATCRSLERTDSMYIDINTREHGTCRSVCMC